LCEGSGREEDGVDWAEEVRAAQTGDLAAYGRLIRGTESMVYAVCRRLLRERADALDATQEAYLRAYRGLKRLAEPAAFPGYLRRTAVRAAQDLRRSRGRATFAPMEQLPEVPVLDEQEGRWSEAQRLALGRALIALPREERLITDRFYHGGWSALRLAEAANTSEATMRKRLQRIRDRLREEIEMSERHMTALEKLPNNLPDRIVELLARPALVAFPENPVAKIVGALREHFSDFQAVDAPEVIDLAAVRARLETDPVYVPAETVFHLEQGRILRYDLTLPLLVELAGRSAPLRLWAAGKVYRNEIESTTRLSAFHQFELLWLDETRRVDPWQFIGRVLEALDAILPGKPQRVSRTEYPFCARAWDVGVEQDGEYHELLGCGVYRPDVVRLLGGDPAQHTAIGLGLGLERLAALHFGIPDIRTMEATRV
jgi:RNA polymerase sigma-70 factor (ECF subfamily)